MATWCKRKIIRPVRDKIFYWLIYSLLLLGPLMPRKLLLRWHRRLARLVCSLSKKQMGIMMSNLTRVFGPESREGEYREVGMRVYENLTMTLTDYSLWAFRRDWSFFSRYFRVQGEEHLRAAYERGKGVLCLIPHTAGWEFSAILPPLLGYKSAGVSSALKNQGLNKLMIQLREQRGMHNISRHRCYEQLVELLNNGECLIIMTDQDSVHIRGEFIDFMGIKAYTPIGCSRLAAETGAAVVPMCTLRNDDDTYTFCIKPELERVYDADGSYDITANTKLQNDALSEIIMENREQWVWMHKRWHTTPESLAKHLKAKGHQPK